MALTGYIEKKVIAILNYPEDYPEGKRVIIEITCDNGDSFRVEQFIVNAELVGLDDLQLRELAWGRFNETELQTTIDNINARPKTINQAF